MNMTASDKISAFSAVVAIASAVAATWATLAVGKLGDTKQENELADRIQCDGRATVDSGVLALSNNSSQHPVKLLFLNIHSPLDQQRKSYRSERYGEQEIDPLQTAYFALPKWTDNNSTSEIDFVMQWQSPNLDRVRVHRCELKKRLGNESRRYFAVTKEEDEWLPFSRSEGFYIPTDAKLRKPIRPGRNRVE